MRFLFPLAIMVTTLGIAKLALSAPVGGGRNINRQRIEAKAEHTIVERFRGGERACVIVQGDHNPVVNVDLFIVDSKGRVVAKDDAGGDLIAAVWYPPRDGNYTIQIKNHGEVENDCYISIK